MAIDNVAARSKRRRLPSVDVPQTTNDELRRSIEALKEHLRMYEGDSGAPKERFVTIEELELAGLIGTKVQGNFALIDSVLGSDVAQGQQAGQGGAVIINEGGGATTLAALTDTNVSGAAANSFLQLVGGAWVGTPLLDRPLTWNARQTFKGCIRIAGIDSGYVEFCHDNTDLNITGSVTTDINLVGLNVDFEISQGIEWGDTRLLELSPEGMPGYALGTLADSSFVRKNLGSELFMQEHRDWSWRPDGLALFGVETSGRRLGRFDVTVAFDIQSLVGTGSPDATSAILDTPQEVPYGHKWSSDGLTFFYLANDTATLRADTSITTPWDVTQVVGNWTGTWDESLVTGLDRGDMLHMSDDGVHIVICGRAVTSGDKVMKHYEMSTPWDLSTAAEVGGSFNFRTDFQAIIDCVFSDDGKKAFLLDGTQAATHYVQEWTLGTAWDMSTLSYAGTTYTLDHTTPATAYATSIFWEPARNEWYVGYYGRFAQNDGVLETYSLTMPGLTEDTFVVGDPAYPTQIDGVTTTITGDAQIDGTTTGTGAATFESTLNVQGAADFDSTLNVDGVADFNANVDINNATLTIAGLTPANNVTIAHDDTDLNITGANTTDINLTGFTALQAGTVDADFDAITATSYGGILEANLLSRIVDEAVSGNWTFSNNLAVTGNLTFGSLAGLDAVDFTDSFKVFDGAFLDSPDVSVSSNGTTITLSFEKQGTGDVRIWFSDGVYLFDATPIATIALTPGTDTAPTTNWVYILQSTKALTVSTTGWPAAEHAPVATVVCQSAASAQTDGLYKVHAWTDHLSSTNNGHLAHLNYWIRQQNATWIDGVALTPTAGVGQFDVATTTGNVQQLHPHSYPAFDTGATDEVLVVNDFTTAFNRVGDLTTLLTDALGNSMASGYFNFVFWGVVSEDDADCQLMINLPTGSYGNETNAILDPSGYDVYEIPDDFKGTGFLIARLTIRHQSAGGGTWSISNNQDLRGVLPRSPSAGGTGLSEAAANTLYLRLDGTNDPVTGPLDITGDITVTGLVDGKDIAGHHDDATIHFTEASIDHGSIAGLGDDDHPQYAEIAGTESISGDWTFEAASGNTNLNLQKAALADQNTVTYKNELGVQRWIFGMAGGTDDDFFIGRYDDSAVWQGSAIYVDGITGQVDLRWASDATKLSTTNTGIDVTGSIVVSGTVDGRDVATDGTNQDNHIADGTIHFTQAAISIPLSQINDVTATAAEVNLLDLAGLTAGWVLSADTATTASWKAPAAGGGNIGGSIADNQVAVGAATADDIEGSAALTFDGSYLQISSAATRLKLEDTAAAVDNKRWEIRNDNERFFIRALNDAQTIEGQAIAIDRTGTTIDDIWLKAPVRISDGTETDYASFSHDGTDFNTAFTNTTDWNITGLTGYVVIDKASAIMLDADATTGRARIWTKNVAGADRNVVTRASSADQLNFSHGEFVTNLLYSNLWFNSVEVFPANWDTAYTWGDHALAGYIGGSITDNQIAVGAATADDIEGAASFLYAAGVLQLSPNSSTNRVYVTPNAGMEYYPGVATGGWARGVTYKKISDSAIMAGMGMLGSNEAVTHWSAAVNPTGNWYDAAEGLTLTATEFTVNTAMTIALGATQVPLMLEANATSIRNYLATQDIAGTERKIFTRGDTQDRLNCGNANFDFNIFWKDNLLFNGVVQTPANWDAAYTLVTTGANPGHTHTGTSISALDAGDTTTGTFTVGRLSPTQQQTPRRNISQYSRPGASTDFNDWKLAGMYAVFSTANTNAPTGESYDTVLVGENSSDVGTQLLMPRTTDRALAYRGWSGGGTFTSWQYALWTDTAPTVAVSATPAELNLLDLSGLTAGWVLSADSATTASWKAPTGGAETDTLQSVMSRGNTTATNLLSTAEVSGAYLGVENLSSSSGYGLSLYNGAVAGEPTYGLMFAGVATYGTYGPVTGGTWAMYFNMNATAGRGYIWRTVGVGNIAGLSNVGDMEIAGGFTANDTIIGPNNKTLGAFRTGTGAQSFGRFGNYGSLGTTYSAASTYIGNNVYVEPTDVVANQYRTAVTHGSYGHTIYQQAGGDHYWYGDDNSVTAGNIVTKKLQMRLLTGTSVSLSVYDDGGDDFFQISHSGTLISLNSAGTGAGRVGMVVDCDFFEIGNKGANSIPLRISDGNRTDYMDIYSDGTDVFQDITGGGAWKLRFGTETGIQATANGSVVLYHNNVSAMATQANSTLGNTSMGNIKDHNGNLHDIGFNVLPAFNVNVSDTLEAMHCGAYNRKTTTTARTLTLEASTSLDFPVDGVTTVINKAASGNYSITQGSGTTLTWLDGTSTLATGNRTIGPGGVATILRAASTAYYMWGTGIS